jgi:hypothetical protein
VQALAVYGLNFDVIATEDHLDEDTAFGMVTGMTELDESAIGDWMMEVVERFDGDVITWRFVRGAA